MLFLCDDQDGQTVLIDASGWIDAEAQAFDKCLNLIGQFICYIDEDTGEETTIQ